jgi:hypothetical protein
MSQAVEFGGTGHFVIATAHAGNLLEAAGKLLKAVSASNSGTRAIFAPKILAVIHLKMLPFHVARKGHGPDEFQALTPAMYRRTPRGLQSLVADGLASVMPYFLQDDDFAGQFGSLGRQYFARALCRADLNAEGRSEGADEAASRWEGFRKFHSGDGDEMPPPFETADAPRLIDAALEEDLHGR